MLAAVDFAKRFFRKAYPSLQAGIRKQTEALENQVKVSLPGEGESK